MYDQYLPVLIAALTVLILGCWNPKVLQVHRDGVAQGHPSYMMLSLFALLAGLLSCYLMKGGKGKGGGYLMM
jgi:hypothetical protein